MLPPPLSLTLSLLCLLCSVPHLLSPGTFSQHPNRTGSLTLPVSALIHRRQRRWQDFLKVQVSHLIRDSLKRQKQCGEATDGDPLPCNHLPMVWPPTECKHRGQGFVVIHLRVPSNLHRVCGRIVSDLYWSVNEGHICVQGCEEVPIRWGS